MSSVQHRLLRYLEDQTREPGARLGPETDLFESGALDSSGLLNLALWIEQEVGRQVDFASYDLSHEWATVGSVLRFIEQCRGQGAPASGD